MLPAYYGAKSNGVKILCAAYKRIACLHPNKTFLVVRRESPFSQSFYREEFGPRLICYDSVSQQRVFASITSRPFLLVRPDDLEGIKNPIHWKLAKHANAAKIFNLLLAPPFIFSTGDNSILSYYSPKDLFIIFNLDLMPALTRAGIDDAYVESSIDDFPIHRYLKMQKPSSRISLYLGKGEPQFTNGLAEMIESIKHDYGNTALTYIKRKHPSSRDELCEWLSESLLLVSLDPFSHIETIATLLGTPVLKPVGYNKKELPGIYRTIDEAIDALKSEGHRALISEQSFCLYSTRIKEHDASLAKLVRPITEGAYSEATRFGHCLAYSKELIYSFASQYRQLINLIATPSSMGHWNSQSAEDILNKLCNRRSSDTKAEESSSIAGTGVRHETRRIYFTY